MYTPNNVDLTIYQGGSFLKAYKFSDSEGNPVDLTGWTARMQIRSSKISRNIVVELTTEDIDNNLTINIDSESTTINIYMSPDQTSSITKDGVYDLELMDANGDVLRFMQGDVIISKEVTR